MSDRFNIAVVGATGLVGGEILKILEEREFPVDQLGVFASESSAGSAIFFCEKKRDVQALDENSFKNSQFDYVLFAGGGSVSEKFAPLAAESGAIVVDNSSFFRLDKDVPLIVPEVNPEDVHHATKRGIIANPNCSTIQMVVLLKMLQDVVPIERVVVSTYQSVSGAGSAALKELESQTSNLLAGREAAREAFPHQIGFNCLPHIDVFQENGMTKEEMKMILESRKILHLPDLRITATAVRVPVFVSHAESLVVEFQSEISKDQIYGAIQSSDALVLMDEPSKLEYPTQLDAAGRDEVFVGRIRRDESAKHSWHFWVVADNLRKGAATNAVQIAELCAQNNIRRAAA